MKTRTREVKTYIVEYLCPEDGCDGLMEHQQGMAIITSDSPKYAHQCNKCGHDEYTDEVYPKAKIEYVDEPWTGVEGNE